MGTLIYLVEDDESIRKLVIYALESQGFAMAGFESAEGFWKAMDERKPAVLINILIIFIISGIWHGAGWNYIIWGALQGIYRIIEELIQKKHKRKKLKDMSRPRPSAMRLPFLQAVLKARGLRLRCSSILLMPL